MAQEVLPWEEFQTQEAPSMGVEIPAPAKEPPAPPSGYKPVSGGLAPIPGGPADPATIAAEAAARKGEGQAGATALELKAKQEGAQKRAATVRSIMGRVEDLYKSDIQGQPLSRLGGALEMVPGLPLNERFNTAANTMLPLIRPLVAQSAKEGDSDKEMQVFMAYIPQASDSDIAIEEKLNLLKVLIGGMVEGKPPSASLAEVQEKTANLKPGETFEVGGQEFSKGSEGGSPPPEKPSAPIINPELLRSFGAGIGDVVEGAGDVLGLIANPANAAVNAVTGSNLTTDLGGYLRNLTGLPEGDPLISAINENAVAALTGAGLSGAVAKQVAPGIARTVLQTLASQPVQQVAGGAGAGAAGEIARQQGAGPLAQAGAALAGGAGAAGVTGLTQALAAPRAAAPAAVQAAEQAGIPVMTSDVMRPQTFMQKWVQTAGERIPFAGTASARAAQQNSRVDAIKDIVRSYGADGATVEPVAADLAATRGAELSKYTGAKNEVIDRLATAGEVPVSRTVDAIDKQIANLESLRTNEVQPIIARLQDWKGAIQGQDLRNVETLRKQLGESFKAPELAAIRGTGEKALSSIYGPLRDDMADFIKTVGERRDVTKWGVANRRLAEMAGELNVNSLKRVLRTGEDTPENVNSLLFSSKPSDVRALYRNLSPAGRANARAAILARAAEKAGGIDEISPQKFVSEVGRLGNSVGVFFEGDDLKRLRGLVSALKLTRRAGEASISPPTGQQLYPFAGAEAITSIFGAPGVATGAAVSTGFLARALESRPVRNLLMQMQAAGPNEQAKLAKRVMEAINAVEEKQ